MEQDQGPTSLFVHGVLLNSHLWRHQLDGLSDIRRCIAVDLLAHGHTEIAADQDVSVTANASMLEEFLDALISIRWILSGTIAVVEFLRSLLRPTAIVCAVSPSPTATLTTIGRLKHSNRFSR
jgi:hypothetical protein